MISFLMDDRDISFQNFANILIVAGKKKFFFSILFYYSNFHPKTDFSESETHGYTAHAPCLTLSRCENIPSQIFSTRRHHIRPSGAGAEAEQRDTALQLLEHAILSVGSGVRAVRL